MPLESVSVTKSILGQASSAMSVTQGVGQGIGSIFILFVIFHHVSSLLDGGKFQIKMLWPLLIYVIVCNFSLVASPIVSFTSAIQQGCASASSAYQTRVLSELTRGRVTDGSCSMWEAFQIRSDMEVEDLQAKKIEEELNDIEIEESMDEESGKKKWNLSSLFQGMKAVFDQGWDGVRKWFAESITQPILGTVAFQRAKWGLLGIVAVIFSWICEFLGLAVTCLGAVMTGIIVAFGPVTWAFAIFPGNQKVIGSWIIRLCQYALYGPIVALIQAFIVTCLFKLGTTASGDGSLTMLMGVLLCNIVALTAVPTIASMIIEGASGAVSLSQGLQTAGSAMATAASIAGAPLMAGYKAAHFIQEAKDRFAGGGEAGRDSAMLHALNSIAKSADPNYTPLNSSGGDAAAGQNPNAGADGN